MADLSGLGRVLVTGATGCLGGQLVPALQAAGYDVVGMGRNREKLDMLGCHGILHDLSNPINAADVPDVDAVVHCAALSAPFGARKDFVRANVDGTRHILALAAEKRVRRFVHISTPSIYFAFEDQLFVSEDHPLPAPVNHYAATKAIAEDLVRAALPNQSIILRPRGIYGAGDTALLPRLLRAARERPLPRLRGGVASIDLTHVDDVVGAIIASLRAPEKACGAAYNISSAEQLLISDIVARVCARAGVDARWRDVPLAPALMGARVLEGIAALRRGHPEPVITRYGLGLFAYRQSLDVRKACAILDWLPQVPFDVGLARTFKGDP